MLIPNHIQIIRKMNFFQSSSKAVDFKHGEEVEYLRKAGSGGVVGGCCKLSWIGKKIVTNWCSKSLSTYSFLSFTHVIRVIHGFPKTNIDT